MRRARRKRARIWGLSVLSALAVLVVLAAWTAMAAAGWFSMGPGALGRTAERLYPGGATATAGPAMASQGPKGISPAESSAQAETASPTPEAAPAEPPAPTPVQSPAPVPEPEVVPYEGPVEHIFFHPLIVYPERAFDGDRMAQGYDDWFVTVPEFQSVLSDLYRNGYVLVDIRSLYEEIPGNGGAPAAIRLKRLMLPPGKKPLVLSVDDANYYTYMRENGNAYKLVLDGEGRVAAYSVAPDGRERISREDEIVPILDAFVEEHPDFSYKGAKGVLAVTGYEGVLGYRTHEEESPEYALEKEAALQVIERLKATGWSFASHSWGHPNAEQADMARLTADTERWKREVEPLTGPTPVYIYPYGARLRHDDPKFRLLMDAGFKLFCGVGPGPYLRTDTTTGTVEMDRRHVDGVALRTQGKRLAPLFDVKKAFDSRRPPA